LKKICQECSSEGKWLPTSISRLESYLGKFIKTDMGIPNSVGLRKNIAYNLQYLQFQIQELKEFNLTSVLQTQIWKVFIIVGTSIIEALLYYLLVSKGFHKITEWEQIGSTSNEVNLNGAQHKIENIIYKKLKGPIPESMTLDVMTKKAENKKLLGTNHTIYKKLNYLRKLRNRVHIYAIDSDTDTDWWEINPKEFKIIKTVLYSFFTSSLFSPSDKERELFDFLL
jgi:hypothetical protein